MAGFGPPRKQATSRAVSQSRISSESPPQPRTDSPPASRSRNSVVSGSSVHKREVLPILRRAEDDALDAALLLHPLIGGNDAENRSWVPSCVYGRHRSGPQIRPEQMAADAKPPLVPDGVLSRDGACPVTVPPHGGISDARPPGRLPPGSAPSD